MLKIINNIVKLDYLYQIEIFKLYYQLLFTIQFLSKKSLYTLFGSNSMRVYLIKILNIYVKIYMQKKNFITL